MRARTSVPLLRRTHLPCMVFFRCSGVSVSMRTSVCCLICWTSFFIPCVVSCLSNPSASLMIGSSRIISVTCSLVSSLEHTVISCPLFVLTVTAVIRCLDVAGSAVASGLVRPVGASCRLVCFDNEPSTTSSGSVLFGDGSAGRWCWCVGAVAIGESVIGNGGCCCCCCTVVCSPVLCIDAAAESFDVLGGGLYATGSGTVVPAVGNLFNPLLLMMSINCLLYFSGIGCLLFVLDRTTFVAMPRSVSPDAVSLPSQIAGRNLFSSLGRSFTCGSW